jgi:hypothetical protein
LKNDDKSQDSPNDGALAFAWETLPELAKSRWEQAVAFGVTIENQLVKAKADRSRAEVERQRIAGEILEATKDVCEEIVADGKRALDSARWMQSEAAKNFGESQAEIEKAQVIRVDAEGYREKIMAEVDQQAQEIVSRARATVERECMELKEQAAREAQRMLGQAEVMRAAIQEELETQRIYSEAARLKANSQEVLARIKAERDGPPVSQGESAEVHLPGLEVQLPSLEGTEENHDESPVPHLAVDEVPAEEPQQPVESEGFTNGKKSARRPSAV